jgi:hypothetical protein
MQTYTPKSTASCAPMVARVGFALISAAIAITIIAYAKSKTAALKSDDSAESLPTSSRRSIPSQYEQDALDLSSILVSAADPLVVQAGEAIRNAFNAQRTTVCASMKLYSAVGAIQYAKKAVALNGTVLYTLEIVFGTNAVLARVALRQNNVGAKFQVIFSIPGPCEGRIQEQLAVSALGKTMPCLMKSINDDVKA